MRAPPSPLKQTVVALLYVAATFSPTAGSILKDDLPPMDGLQNTEEVSDDILGNMRGKFVGGGKIVNFGVQMVSTWQNTQGQILAATANLNVNIANASRPVVQFVPHLTIVEAVAPIPSVPPAALQSAGATASATSAAWLRASRSPATATVSATMRASPSPTRPRRRSRRPPAGSSRPP